MKLALLAGTQSGCGKTSVMLALLQYFRHQKQSIAAFKSGPDFLDPLWHQAVTGRPSYNLDTQMIGIDLSRQIIQRHQSFEWGLIEGVMGLFDGRAGVGEAGSSIDLAAQLDSPVILVVDAKGMSGSLVPLVHGFCHYAEKKSVTIQGIIANRVGSAHHASLLEDLLVMHELPPLIAWMKKDAPALSERHLGLKRPNESLLPDFSDYFQVDDSALKNAFSSWPQQQIETHLPTGLLSGQTIAVAKDDACCFLYPANLDWLVEQGARLEFFSLLTGETVPDNADALWLPGGYPELYAQQLSQSPGLQSIKDFILADKPVLAECGGAMLLGRQLIHSNGCAWPMAGVLPFNSRMQNKLASLGYRQEQSGPRGHEFHHSLRESDQAFEPAFELPRGDNGIRYKNLRASYIHWYFASSPEIIATWFKQ